MGPNREWSIWCDWWKSFANIASRPITCNYCKEAILVWDIDFADDDTA